jgi:hypothetical protein
MTWSTKLISGSCSLASVAIVAVAMVAGAGLTSRQAQADEICCAGPPPNGTTDDAILYADPNLHVENADISGNIAIAEGGGFRGSGMGTITGQVQFAGQDIKLDGLSQRFQPDGITITGMPPDTFNNANVQEDFKAVTMLSRTLRDISGTPITITGGGSVDATSVKPVNGNSVFTGTIGHINTELGPESTFTAGTTFTIHGSSSDFVVINIPSTDGLGFDGSIVLEGGITSDHVLFNFDKGNFDNLTGGDTLTIDTNGNPTTGIFLDPNGDFQITDSMIFGRIFGGGSQVDSTISSSNPSSFRTSIVAPPPFPTPEPTSLVLLGSSLAVFGIIRRRQRPAASP